MINGELRRTNFFHYDEVVNDHKKEFEKTKINSIFYFFIYSLNVVCFFSLLVRNCGGVILTLKVSIGGRFALMSRYSNVHDDDGCSKGCCNVNLEIKYMPC